MTSYHLIVPDMQIPDHDMRAIRAVLALLRNNSFDSVQVLGDELDAPQPSRWNKGYAGEYAATLQHDIDTCHSILSEIVYAAGDAPVHLMRSNHGERIRTYLQRYAPALSSLKALEYEQLLGLDELGITYHERPYEFTKGFVMAHGDEGSLVQTAAGTAMGLAKKWGVSVVCGHTHKAGVQHQHLALNGKIQKHLWGVEAGHLMKFGDGKSKADYLKAGSANWQQAVVVVVVDGKETFPILAPIVDGRLYWDGAIYSGR